MRANGLVCFPKKKTKFVQRENVDWVFQVVDGGDEERHNSFQFISSF